MYGGELIHQTTDNFGSIEVVDFQQDFRSLHFGNHTQQSAMLLANPFILVHKYTQAMMLPLCWIKPRRVLVLGLGSGSIVKYLYNFFQDVSIDAVELRADVINIARDYFLLPDCDDRLNIYQQSAVEWLTNYDSVEKYDLIIVDMFLTTSSGIDTTENTSSYIDYINSLLSEDGAAVFNHLGSDVFSNSSFDALSNLFSNQLFSINIDLVNVILIASKGAVPVEISDNELYEMQAKYSLPYQLYYDLMHSVI